MILSTPPPPYNRFILRRSVAGFRVVDSCGISARWEWNSPREYR